MKKRSKFLLYLSSALFCQFIFCEVFIYYLVIFQCSWPKISSADEDKALILADTHLIGPIHGHWFDRLRREWQMNRSFQSAIFLFKPEIVIILGDLFDEGARVSKDYWIEYVKRFNWMFDLPENIQLLIAVGNHDIGFHYAINERVDQRFKNTFNTSSVSLVQTKSTNWILLNSMAMEGDNCDFCRAAMRELQKINKQLNCDKNIKDCLNENQKSMRKNYIKPILLQHFPMYRVSDEICIGPDSAPENEKSIKFRPNWDCLSKESSIMLLNLIEPRLILSGHTHHYCHIHHNYSKSSNVPEYSVPSFNWRNRDDPSFFLGHFGKVDFHLSQCFLPKESTVFRIYITFAIIDIIFILSQFFFFRRFVSFLMRITLSRFIS